MRKYVGSTSTAFVFSLLLALCVEPDLKAADSLGWKTNGLIGLNFTQVSLSNWAGGGQDNIAVGGLFNYAMTYSQKDENWLTTLDIGYGQTKLGKQEFRKSDDKFNLASKYNYKASGELSYAALLDLRTQIAEGLSYTDTSSKRISNIFAPANIILGLGITYTPSPALTITLAPLSNKLLIVADKELSRQRAFGVDSGKTVKSDLGALLSISYKQELMKNVTLESKLNTFAPYAAITENQVNWNTLLSLKVNELISAYFALDVIYDPNTVVTRDDGTKGPETQIRDVIGIGFSYKF